MQGYCMKEHKKREMKNVHEVTMKNGRKAYKGECPVDGTKMFVIGGGNGKKSAAPKRKRSRK